MTPYRVTWHFLVAALVLPHLEGSYHYPATSSDDLSQGKREEDYSWNEEEADTDSNEA